MKYLLLFAIVMVGLWWWRNNRRADIGRHDVGHQATANRRRPALAATEIVACDVCQVHLPRAEALTGPTGVYCSDAHRRQARR